jgi:hypothetical protein
MPDIISKFSFSQKDRLTKSRCNLQQSAGRKKKPRESAALEGVAKNEAVVALRNAIVRR